MMRKRFRSRHVVATASLLFLVLLGSTAGTSRVVASETVLPVRRTTDDPHFGKPDDVTDHSVLRPMHSSSGDTESKTRSDWYEVLLRHILQWRMGI